MSLLYDNQGERKYLTIKERAAFLLTAKTEASHTNYTFCLVLAYTGARVSEVLALTPRQIDCEAGIIVIRSLKKRQQQTPIYRAIPLPAWLLSELDAAHGITAARHDPQRVDQRLWPWCRTTAWKRVREIMVAANIAGTHASPKGLRHGFGVAAVVAGVPVTTLKKWLGHARLDTTMVYTQAIGAEERVIAKRMWKTLMPRDHLM